MTIEPRWQESQASGTHRVTMPEPLLSSGQLDGLRLQTTWCGSYCTQTQKLQRFATYVEVVAGLVAGLCCAPICCGMTYRSKGCSALLPMGT